MEMNRQISSNVYDRYHGSVKAKELHLQKQHGHGDMHAGLGEEGRKPGLHARDGFDGNVEPVRGDGRPHQPRDKIGENGHRHGEIEKHAHSRNFDKFDFEGPKSNRQDADRFSYGKHDNRLKGIHWMSQGTMQIHQFTKITIVHPAVFSGDHLESPEKRNEAHQNFLNAARDFIKNPGEREYKSLNEAMMKLMDPKFAPAITGGAARVSIRDVHGGTMAKITMEITPAPTKTLEEAREDLKNAYSTRRDGEKGIAGIRAEAYTNYIRALSEKFKKDGVISHTNNTPTTPVYKSSVIYVVKVTQVNVTNLHEIKKPEFGHNPHGRLTFKDRRGFWNDRQNHKSYVDMLRHDSKKSHSSRDFKYGKAVGASHGHSHSGEGRVEKADYKRHNKTRTDKAS